MSVKQLPLAQSPIRGYMMYSYHLAVTLTHVDAWPWFYSNFVQLQCDPVQLELSEFPDNDSAMAKGEVHFTEGTSPYNPWLSNSPQMDDATMAVHLQSMSGYIAGHISQDFYVETYLDEYYIQALANGGLHHFGHRLLLYGYDESQRRFDIIGFDKNAQYKKLTCSYDELDAAFANISPQYADRTKLFKPSANALPPTVFDRQKFVDVLKEYLASTNTLLNPNLRGDLRKGAELWYGLRTYDFLGEFIRKSIALKAARPESHLDFRGFQMLWEHKKCMLDRLKWLNTIGYTIPSSVLEKFAQVLTLSETARTRVVMCRRGLLPTGKGYLNEIPRLLESAKKIEAEVLQDLVSIMTQSAV